MNKSNSIDAIDRTNLTNQTKFRLDEISKIENHFIEEINRRRSCSKKLSEYVAVFDYIDQALIVLRATSGGVSIISFTTIAEAPVGIASASLTLFFSPTTGIVEKILNITRKKKKKKLDKVLMLAKSKLNSIETLISQALIDMEINHEEFITILKIWKDERQFKKWRRKTWNYEIEYYKIKDLSEKLLSILCHQKKILVYV